jgi:hypothetical protein
MHVRGREAPLRYESVETAFHDFGAAVALDPEAKKKWEDQLQPLRVPLSDEDDIAGAPAPSIEPDQPVAPVRLVTTTASDRVLRSASQVSASSAMLDFLEEFRAVRPTEEEEV